MALDPLKYNELATKIKHRHKNLDRAYDALTRQGIRTLNLA